MLHGKLHVAPGAATGQVVGDPARLWGDHLSTIIFSGVNLQLNFWGGGVEPNKLRFPKGMMFL